MYLNQPNPNSNLIRILPCTVHMHLLGFGTLARIAVVMLATDRKHLLSFE